MKNKFFKIRPPPEWGIEPVPENMKILRFIDISILWFSLAIGLLVIQAGAFLTLSPEYGGFGLNILEAFLVSLIGSLIGSFILALASIIGINYSVTSMVSLRPSFGLLGSYLPSILNVIQLIGWTIFEFIIMGEAATSISGQFLGSITKYIWITFFAIIVYLMIVYGPLIVIRQWLEKFAIWFAIMGATWLTYQLLNMKTLTINLISSAQFNTILLALDLVIAMPVSWLPLVSDYNRFAKSKKDGFFGTFISYTIANTWFYLIGAMLALIYPKEAITYSMALIFFGLFALLIILIDEPDNAFADVYSATVSIQNIFPKQKQWKIALIITILCLLFAFSIPIIQYENFLLLIGASFVPVFSILLSDYFIVNKSNYKKDLFYSINMKINWKAIISWIMGFIVYYYFAYINVTIGATIPSIILTFIIYTILNYFKR
jgi:putative hydroxymethylpyrimidine transporter CytX